MKYNWRSQTTTHQPVLFAAAEACDGPIAEFGCGHGSTELLHEVAERRGLRLLSLDNNAEWLERWSTMASPFHRFRLVEDWETELERPEWQTPWGLVFVDQVPWKARAATISKLRDVAELVVAHDSEYAARKGFFGRMLRDVNGAADPGERDFGDVFESWREFFPPEPWPWPPSGPATLLGSNQRDVDEIRVDFNRHLPLWWRFGRHVRGWLPQPIRMRVANRVGWRARLP